MGIANAYAGLEMGVAIYDSTVAGLGGCPFAAHKGAAAMFAPKTWCSCWTRWESKPASILDRLIEVAQLAEELWPSAAGVGEDGRQFEITADRMH